MKKQVWPVLGGLAFVVVLSFQFRQIGALRAELAALRRQQADRPSASPSAREEARPSTQRVINVSNGALGHRVATLEQTVAELSTATEYLRRRGALPLTTNSVQDLTAQFADASRADRDRLNALRLLRRNRGMSDEVVTHAVNWLQTASEADTRRDILQQLEGLTNAAIKGPILALLERETSNDVREQAAENLERFVEDPAVEDKLWQMAQNDPDPEVREEARDSISEGRVTEARAAALQQRALNPQASLDERLTAFEALREANIDSPEVVSRLLELAQGTQDPSTRARLFSAFDGASDPLLKAPLVAGLQDPNPLVREEAADALSTFSSEPIIRQWLDWVAQNDPDPRVQREATSARREGERRAQREQSAPIRPPGRN